MSEQLTGMDASFLSLETPSMPMHVVGVIVLDPAGGEGYSRERLRGVIADRMHLMRPFVRRLVQVPLGLDRPYWHYDTDLDLDAHLFDATLPPPGDLRALGAFVGEVAAEPLDRSRPLWELHVVDGLADGRVALVAKVHHATLYGAAGAEFIAELFDLEPAPRTDLAPAPADGRVDGDGPPGTLTLARRAVLHQANWPLSAARLAGSLGRNAWTTARAAARIVSRHGSAALPFTAPRTPISGMPTGARTAAFAGLSLAEVKAVKDAAGVTVNDAVLAAVTLALRGYLARRGALPGRPLVASCPVEAGAGAAEGTNKVGAMLVPLPMDVTEPAALLERVHAATVEAKAFTAATGKTTIAELADVTPPAALNAATWLGRTLRLSVLSPPMQNLVVSNVMGPPIPLYMAGARVAAVFPMGPLLPGAGMNVTVLSNTDRLDVGIMACPDLVDDVWEIADSLGPALQQLRA